MPKQLDPVGVRAYLLMKATAEEQRGRPGQAIMLREAAKLIKP